MRSDIQKRADADERARVRGWLLDFKLVKSPYGEVEWIMLKLSCSRGTAKKLIEKARATDA